MTTPIDLYTLMLIAQRLAFTKPAAPTGEVGLTSYRTYIERRTQWETDVLEIYNALPASMTDRNRFLVVAGLNQSPV